MTRKLALLFIGLFCASLFGAAVTKIGGSGTTKVGGSGKTKVAAVASAYLVNQNFEGTGYDNGETWTEANNPDEDYTVTALKGSQSLYTNALVNATTYTTYSGQTTVYAHFRIRYAGLAGSGENTGAFTDNPVTVSICALNIDSSGNAKLYANGGTSAASATTLSASTTYYVWLKFVQSGTCELAVSTSTTKPTSDGSGNVFLTRTGGSETAGGIYFASGTFQTFIVDNVLVSTAVIGDNPSP